MQIMTWRAKWLSQSIVFSAFVEPGDGRAQLGRTVALAKNLPQLKDISISSLDKPGSKQQVSNFSLNVDYALGEHTLTGVFGYSDYDYTLATDLDGVAVAGSGSAGLSFGRDEL